MILIYLYLYFMKCTEQFEHYVNDPKYDEISFVVQFVKFWNTDSKTFVDTYLRKNYKEIRKEFNKMIKEHGLDINKLKREFLQGDMIARDKLNPKFINEILDFYKNNFEKDANSFKEGKVVQKTEPEWVSRLSSDIKPIAERIFYLWGQYGKISKNTEDRTTKLHLDGIFFVPGGRFQELYYWDSFWILIGLIESDMDEYAFDIIKCFVQLINRFGYIPNGTRAYYVGRTQPPVFCQMLYKLYTHTKNDEIKEYILTEGLKAAEAEYDFLMTNRRIKNEDLENEILNMYVVDTNKPRLESYKEDLTTLASNPNLGSRRVFSNLWTGAESGWDFSSRWLVGGPYLSNIDIINIIPVDLNAFMLENEKILIKFNQEIQNRSTFSQDTSDKINLYTENRSKRWEAMNRILFNKNLGCWNDYNFRTNTHNDSRFYFSNIMPLFYMEDLNNDEHVIKNILNLYKESLFGHPGGVPCSGKPKVEDEVPQQWDFPNSWAPHVQMFTEFLIKNGYDELAYHVGRSFFNSVKSVTKKGTVVFMEKYNCESMGIKGDGGEYTVQEGFGWTNGTVTYLLKKFGERFDQEFDHSQSYKEICEFLSKDFEDSETNQFETPVEFNNFEQKTPILNK
ncbi:Trehalase [Nosema granulosis]|uniref:Trehalase n=1 Tax=Nosema granulosis TaxID=83296 RepID=A0A9P6H285_9MICR|nr:Trehalase [Nosema granulosis]